MLYADFTLSGSEFQGVGVQQRKKHRSNIYFNSGNKQKLTI